MLAVIKKDVTYCMKLCFILPILTIYSTIPGRSVNLKLNLCYRIYKFKYDRT